MPKSSLVASLLAELGFAYEYTQVLAISEKLSMHP